jgi:NAD(P)-dependent dehydrogenase (short-subunit alcohol dehydrogenase family)
MDLSNKSAVITGAGNGIGKAIALALARVGVNVALADIEESAAEQVAAEAQSLGVKSMAMKVDVSDESEIRKLADAAWGNFGSVQLLFNNAGVMHATKQLLDTTKEEFDWCFAVNVAGVMNGIRIFGPRFAASNEQCWIVNTGSEHSFGVPHVTAGLYTATKHAVLALSDVLRRELPDHVGVSVLCPGIVESTLWRATERRQNSFGGAEPGNELGAAAMALGLPAEDVAKRVIKSIKDENFYILTHPHVIEYAAERWRGAEEAFKSQAPRYEGDDQYTVEKIVARLTGA